MPYELPTGLQNRYERLLSQDALRHMPGIPVELAGVVKGKEIASLLNAAASLSMNDGHEQRTMAYEIATRSAALFGSQYPGVIPAAELILSRLGNFPGCGLLRKRFDSPKHPSALLQLEMRMRKIENTNRDLGSPVALTDFQFDALELFSGTGAVSLSAPTSAGKSFLLGLEIVRRLKTDRKAGIAYIVPTRALIRQVVIELRELFVGAKIELPFIRSIPRPIAEHEAPNGFVYVLTQERLLSLLNSDETMLGFTTLIVDEAQEVQSGSRGILLETAIENFRFQFPHARVIFASPLSQNPESLLELFNFAGTSRSEQHSPVSQNVVLVEPVQDSPRRAAPILLWKEKRLPLGEVELGFKFNGNSSLRRMALFARGLMQKSDSESSCILYANGARDAESMARHLKGMVPALNPLDPDVATFADFLKKFVHPEYELANVLAHGIAFHYGTMPGSVRAGIEDLFKARKLRFLCCTSTLLQGVNLPAQHIVIEAPKRGNEEPMERSDFLNLAGRAGRLKQEFHGNVWCLMPHRWEQRCFEGASLNLIVPAFDEVLRDGGTAIRQAMIDDTKLNDPDEAVSAMGRLFTEFTQKGRDFDTSKIGDPKSFELTLEMLEELRVSVRLPPIVFSRNSGIHPRRLEALYAHFLEQKNLNGFIPIAPFKKKFWASLTEVFRITQKYLSGVENDSYKYYAVLASKWVHEEPLSSIISDEIKYREEDAKKTGETCDRRDIIYSVVGAIEHVLRFTYVKNLRAYNDVLTQALIARGASEVIIRSIKPLHLYMECGASKPVTLSLISLGLNRMAALLLSKKVVLSASASPEECLSRCRETIRNAKGLKLPTPVLREVQSFAGSG